MAWGAAGYAWADDEDLDSEDYVSAGGDEDLDPADFVSTIPDFAGKNLVELSQLTEERRAVQEGIQAELTGIRAQLVKAKTREAAVKNWLSVKQLRAERALVERYKMQRHGAGLVEALLSAQDFQDFLAGIEYIEAASEVGVDYVRELRADRAEIEQAAAELQVVSDETTARLEEATAELEKAKAARDELQSRMERLASVHLIPDDADWDAGEEAFVAVWAPRLDAYLGGSPLSGQGEAFAKAAWANHIDPRFSAAISTIESSKGLYCIRPYNAWGWGAADSNPYGLASEWASWEQAINAHAHGLASGYGYTVTLKGAQKYCSSWEDWYVNVTNEMNRI